MRLVLFLSSLKGQITAFVHADALACPVERARHQTFIAARLGFSLAAFALLPAYLTFHGMTAPWEAIAFAWMVLPVVAVVHVSRTGRLVEAHALCLAGIIGLVVTITLGRAACGAALAWLILVPFEAAAAARVSLIVAGCVAALLVSFGMAMAARFGLMSDVQGASLATNALFAVPGIIYATALALAGQRLSDIRRQLERAGSERYRVLSDAVGDVMLRLDRFGGVMLAGRESQSMFGLAPHDLVGRGLFERIHVADRPAFLKAVADAATSSDAVTVTLRLRTSAIASERGAFDEPVFAWAEMRIRQSPLLAGGQGTIVAMARNVTTRKHHEQELEAARAEAERTNAWKDRFLANVSHELRTPLNAIIGFAEMLASPQLAPRDTAKQREYAQIIHTSGQHLLEVVNTILDMSKIEAGSFDILPEPFEVAPLIEACCDMVRLKAEQAGVQLAPEPSATLGELVADKRACKQILINLLSNAVKFTPAGGRVTVGARLDGASVVICVSDTGIGIMPLDLPHIGDPFFQAHGSYDRRYDGTGLGLSVVRGLVGLHGGSISIESAPGAGTSVSIRLPLDCRRVATVSRGPAKIDAIYRQVPADLSVPDNAKSMVKKIA
ncbi:MAG: PAS domain-containing sensor histidine kinase [Methylobacteriaceae bacterium]|nr:PAS domain-containing sensor histidine kinase [Methylobacteriaceae bacterium]